ncbi:nuclear speckle splicing regulatory protein 1 [Hylaeus anthracinus]|uniref:nuclear speckle splicing regulatory protein 1 n=1 Tax=Hylaeus volcanicus TaxID=313075 RepID=UPI0023B802B4|nr:nuclear speckle splicing regulatory protein 1 [Hylaeus volcanicus]XP_053995890.1 nuclear speckle splicing regulatory protein 1 [Hylaeus anthracinus]
MLSKKEEKQYGLILPKKQQPITPKASNIFADDDSDEEDATHVIKKVLKAEEAKNKIKKQTRLNMQKALKEDPTIYQYDEVYDDMERTKSLLKEAKDEKKKPKYIQNLLVAAERRKREQEHRIERMVQKEREAEGAMYADKESFVTSAYRAKLEEFKQLEEEESRMDRLESIADVRKQQDMSGFYRHLYEQTVKNPEESENTDNTHEGKTTELESVNKNTNTIASNIEQISTKNTKKSRQYRQRIMEEDSDTDSEIPQRVESKTKVSIPEIHKNVEMEDVVESNSKKSKEEVAGSEPSETLNTIAIEDTSNRQNVQDVPENCENDSKVNGPKITAKAKIEAEKKERSKIWEKRTVGPVFEAALQRYYARKSLRLSTT